MGTSTQTFWYGLKIIHYLTSNGQWEMRLNYQYENKQWSYLHYNQFSVGSASEEYPLTVGGFTGVGRDLFALRPLNGKKFSTPDNDNDNKNSVSYVTVQLYIRVDGGIIMNVFTLTSTDNHLIYIIVMHSSLRPKEIISHNNS